MTTDMGKLAGIGDRVKQEMDRERKAKAEIERLALQSKEERKNTYYAIGYRAGERKGWQRGIRYGLVSGTIVGASLFFFINYLM